jgi:hypothetical protein
MALTQQFLRTPLHQRPCPELGCTLWIKDESACATGTFKDRLAWALARQEEHHYQDKVLITCITLGNTLMSVSHYLNNSPETAASPQILGFFPEGFSDRKIGPDTHGYIVKGIDVLHACRAKGARTIEVDLTSCRLDQLAIERLSRRYVPDYERHRDITYGIGVPTYAQILEEALQDMPVPPQAVLIPVGAGILFDECVAVIEQLRLTTQAIGVSVIEPTSVADKIYGYYSPFYKGLLQKGASVHPQYPRHWVLTASEKEVFSSLEWAARNGYNAEPSAAAALAPLFRSEMLFKGDILWINTGNGLSAIHSSMNGSG